MRVAFISDIHANLPALEAVLSDAARQHIHEFVCLGDIVGYGPHPRECMDRVLSVAAISVIGNHDAYAAFDRTLIRGLREDVADGIVLARSALDEAQLDILRHMPYSVRRRDVVCVHSSLSDPPTFPYVRTARDAREHFEAQSSPLGVIGHSHVPEVWEHSSHHLEKVDISSGSLILQPNTKYLANMGSVGQPRDGDPRACYVVFDEEAQTVWWRRVEYDIEETAAAMRSIGMPDYGAQRLFKGV